MITDNNLLDDNRPYHYQRNTPVQQDLLINFNNNDTDNEINNENLLQQLEVNNENIPQQQYENEHCNENSQLNKNNTREGNTQESTTSAQNASNMEHRQMLEHRQIPDLSEFKLEVLVQDKTHLMLNLT